MNKRAREAPGKPMTAWEDNGEGGYFSYTQPHAVIRWDKNKAHAPGLWPS